MSDLENGHDGQDGEEATFSGRDIELTHSAEAQSSEPVPVSVDYGKPMADLVAEGHFRGADPDVNDESYRHLTSGAAEVEALVADVDRPVRTKNYADIEEYKADVAAINAGLESRDLEPANTRELLEFAAQHPDQLGLAPIAAIGDPMQARNSGLYASVVYEDATGRNLKLIQLSDLSDSMRFLGVRRPKQPE